MVAFAARSSLKKILVGIVQEGSRPDYLIKDNQRRGHKSAPAKFPCKIESGGIHAVGKDRAPLPHRLRRHRALFRTKPQSDKTFCHLAVGLFAKQFIARLATPEVHAGNLEELSRRPAKQSDQAVRIRALAGCGRDPQQQLLEPFVGARSETGFPGKDRGWPGKVQASAASRH